MEKLLKVMEGLECCKESTNDDPFARCMECPYNDVGVSVQDCRAVLSADALELLKEHEPVEPIAQLDRDEDYIFLCSNCKEEIFGGDILHDNYCTTCGRLVNWHGRY